VVNLNRVAWSVWSGFYSYRLAFCLSFLCFRFGKCVGKTSLLILRSVGILPARFNLFHCRLCRPLRLNLTFWGLAKVAIFTTNFDAENELLSNHKCVFGALNRQFLVGAVISILSYPHISLYCPLERLVLALLSSLNNG